MFEQLCYQWWAAEHRGKSGIVPFRSLPDAKRAEIEQRVIFVLSGEIPYSCCSPGDLAIWNGRARDREVFDSWLNGHKRQWQWTSWYDTLMFGQGVSVYANERLFGSRNIGAQQLCNLQIPGTLGTDQHAFVHSIHATVPFISELRHEIEILLNRTLVQLFMGDRQVRSPSHLIDLVSGQSIVDKLFPVRQWMSMTVNIHDLDVLDRLNAAIEFPNRWGIRINLEGFIENRIL
jgi:hypothetical protein